ncbi:MAG: hypothetical protein GY839_13550 [candidate division Zixibacteria bacterium]|nr:hypothetical protein [candidate division Zixibacteria bacterium]
MKCFFQGFTRPDEDDDEQFNGYVSFVIPGIGIKFRGQYKGDSEECEYASLLALLEFIELNSHLFVDKRIEIFGNNFDIVSQVNSQEQPSSELEQFCSLAQSYKKKFPFVLDWIPTEENMAQDGLSI